MAVCYYRDVCLCGSAIGGSHFVVSENCPLITAAEYVCKKFTLVEIDAWVFARFLVWTWILWIRSALEEQVELAAYVAGLVKDSKKIWKNHEEAVPVLMRLLKHLEQEYVDEETVEMILAHRKVYLDGLEEARQEQASRLQMQQDSVLISD